MADAIPLDNGIYANQAVTNYLAQRMLWTGCALRRDRDRAGTFTHSPDGVAMRNILMRSVLFAGALVALTSVPARADTITPLLSGQDPGTSITYDAIHSSGELHSGDGFTIFDIGEFTGIISTPTNWNSGAWLIGSPYGASAFDDPTLANVHFIYVGPIIFNVSAETHSGFVVGTNSLLDTFDTWRSRDHELGGDPGDEVSGAIVVPLGPAGPGAVPDGGSTAALLGSALAAFGVLRRRFS